MPMPPTYRHASKEFRAFLADAKDRMNLESDNMAYTAVDAVFQVFRRRLTAQQGHAVDLLGQLVGAAHPARPAGGQQQNGQGTRCVGRHDPAIPPRAANGKCAQSRIRSPRGSKGISRSTRAGRL